MVTLKLFAFTIDIQHGVGAWAFYFQTRGLERTGCYLLFGNVVFFLSKKLPGTYGTIQT